MRLELKDGNIVINTHDLLENMPADSLVELIQSLACQEAVVKHVADQIIDGWTDDGYYAARSVAKSEEPNTALDTAIRRIAENSSEVARKEISEMGETIKSLKNQLCDSWNEIEKLRRKLNGNYVS